MSPVIAAREAIRLDLRTRALKMAMDAAAPHAAFTPDVATAIKLLTEAISEDLQRDADLKAQA